MQQKDSDKINYEPQSAQFKELQSYNELKTNENYLSDFKLKLQSVLHSFKITAEIEQVSVGPIFITYKIKLSSGVSIKKIINLKDDIAFSTESNIIDIKRIEGSSLIAIIVERLEKEIVSFNDLVKSDDFKNISSKLAICLGKNIFGENKIINLEETSHILISGTTGSGKSMFLHSVINSILHKATPDDVQFILIDTKCVEFSLYKNITHLLFEIITDREKAVRALKWITLEIERRYQLLFVNSAKNFDEYNEETSYQKLNNIIVIIDEFADIIEYYKKEIEESIYNITQKGKKVGIYLVLSTERPSTNIINGTIKANFSTRLVFKLPSRIDSQLVLDYSGAEELLGNGDLLLKEIYKNVPERYQGAFISIDEIKKLRSLRMKTNKYLC